MTDETRLDVRLQDHLNTIVKNRSTARIPVYVISLRDSDIRRQKILTRLEEVRISFQFVDAIDGRTERLPDEFDGARVVREGFWSESALACAMSHRKVHRIVMDGPEELALILEDDAKPADDFRKTLASVTTLKFDILKLEGGPAWPLAIPSRVSVGALGGYSVVVGMTPSLGSAAYLLTRSSAKRLCSLPLLDQMPDEAFGDPRLALQVLELDPYAIVQDRETSTMVNLQQYPNPPRQFRRNFVARLLHSVYRRSGIIRAHGLPIALALEMKELRTGLMHYSWTRPREDCRKLT